MPRLLDPRGRVPIVLSSDLDKPEEQQPTFYAKVLSCDAWASWNDGYEEAIKPAEGKTVVDSVHARYVLTAAHLVGWDKMVSAEGEIVYDAARAVELLKQIIDPMELFELMNQIGAGGRLTFEDKKKSESPPCSSTGNCAATASAESASTPPASESPPTLGVPRATKEVAPPAKEPATSP